MGSFVGSKQFPTGLSVLALTDRRQRPTVPQAAACQVTELLVFKPMRCVRAEGVARAFGRRDANCGRFGAGRRGG